jgi:hypothetical protein
MSLYKHVSDVFGPPAGISHNVLAVTDVFLRPIRKNAKHFYGRKKMWRSNTPQRGVAPTGVLRSLAAVRRRTVTDLLCEGWAYTIFILFIS